MSISSRVSFSVLTLCLGLASACGGDDDNSGSSSCPQVSGSWTTDGSGTCPVSDCTVTQSGCSLRVQCTDGTELSGTVGSVSGESAPVSLRHPEGTCTGKVDDIGAGKPPELEVDCTIAGQACDTKLDCLSGACVATGNEIPGSGSGGGSNGSGGRSNGSGGGSNGSGGSGEGDCCDSSDSCGYANDDFCDCPDQAWDAADCATGSGGSVGGGSGGSSGSDRGPTCELGAAAVCTCLEGTDSPCVGDDAVSLYNSCLAELAESEFIYCFADYVDSSGSINCTTASNACIP